MPGREQTWASLEEAVAALAEIGEGDPLTIARLLLERHGEWAREQAALLAGDVIAEIARKHLGAVRRSREVALRPGDVLAQGEMKLARMWVPEVGYKCVADVTASDLRARADWYDQLARASLVRSRWCRQVALLMEADGAATLGDLERELPPLAAGELAA